MKSVHVVPLTGKGGLAANWVVQKPSGHEQLHRLVAGSHMQGEVPPSAVHSQYTCAEGLQGLPHAAWTAGQDGRSE